MPEVILNVEDLKVSYREIDGAVVKAVDGVSFEVRKGECFGLVGESGSGKTTVAKAILKLLPANASMINGTISLKGTDIATVSEHELNRLRWADISLVTQSAMNALNPVTRISTQMLETFHAHGASVGTKNEMLEQCMQLFEMVGLNRNRIFDFPHQFSGGMRQRVIIAMALALRPSLIIADEPTTALDVIMQAQIINLLKSLSEELDISVILITHDMGIVAEMCHRVGVMYAGRLMEYGDLGKVFSAPHHPYTMGLKGAFPSIRDLNKTLISIPGSPPVLINRSPSCGFSERCPFSIARCDAEVPKMLMIEDGHYAACHRSGEAGQFREEITDKFSANAGVSVES